MFDSGAPADHSSHAAGALARQRDESAVRPHWRAAAVVIGVVVTALAGRIKPRDPA